MQLASWASLQRYLERIKREVAEAGDDKKHGGRQENVTTHDR